MFSFLSMKYLNVESFPALLSLSPHFCFLELPPKQLSETKPSPQVLILETSKLKCYSLTICCSFYLTDAGQALQKSSLPCPLRQEPTAYHHETPVLLIPSLQDVLELFLTCGSPRSDYKLSVDKNFQPCYVIFAHSK